MLSIQPPTVATTIALPHSRDPKDPDDGTPRAQPRGVAFDYGLVHMPTTVFISPRGTLLEQKDGEFTEVQLEATINRLFFP